MDIAELARSIRKQYLKRERDKARKRWGVEFDSINHLAAKLWSHRHNERIYRERSNELALRVRQLKAELDNVNAQLESGCEYCREFLR